MALEEALCHYDSPDFLTIVHNPQVPEIYLDISDKSQMTLPSWLELYFII